MPKVVKIEHALKPIESIGVKVGDSYYKWKMKSGARGSVKRVSKTMPRPSQLTLSEFKSSWRGFLEEIDDMELDDSLFDNIQELAGRIRDLGNDCQEKYDGMPENLQAAPSAELLQTRVTNCEAWADALESLSKPDEPDEQAVRDGVEREAPWTDDDYKAAQDTAWNEAQEEYKGDLQSLKEDAANSDPGEE